MRYEQKIAKKKHTKISMLVVNAFFIYFLLKALFIPKFCQNIQPRLLCLLRRLVDEADQWEHSINSIDQSEESIYLSWGYWDRLKK